MSLSELHMMSRSAKRAIFLTVDSLIVPISLYLAFCLRYEKLVSFDILAHGWVLFPVMTGAGVLAIAALRLDRIKLNAFENSAVTRIGAVALCLTATAMMASFMLQATAPRSVPLIFGFIFFISAVGYRLGALALMQWIAERDGTRLPVAIYGAGSAGIQLASALRQDKVARPVFFVDDNIALHGLMISGLPVYPPDRLGSLLLKFGIRQILLAIPSLTRARRATLIDQLKTYDAEVKVLPSYAELMAGKGLAESLRPVSADALLGRDKVDLDTPEIAKAYAGRVVMVTGAGGSIGSELCRQLLNCNPRRLVLFEQSEHNLYQIDRELRAEPAAARIEITARLGSVTDRTRVSGVISDEGVEIILHAAAYKHVPLVEENELEGARNNVLGTQIVALAAADAGIERFILVSTDKAVRPTNVMGATKRLAELVVQDIQTRSAATKFAIVRFGNVLGSSGSVLPLFESQIAKGGPVTVTHKDVTRFFMTIPEAARLVLLAGAFAKDGDVFVLDMGAPQKIIDIAHQMIRLSGRRVKDPKTGLGDIEIAITGLRPGEKLYEELLIDGDSLRPTPHPKILCAHEGTLSQIEVASMIRELGAAIDARDNARLRALIAHRVEGYRAPRRETSAN